MIEDACHHVKWQHMFSLENICFEHGTFVVNLNMTQKHLWLSVFCSHDHGWLYVHSCEWQWLCHRHETTRFQNLINENMFSFKFESWNKKLKSKNTMCAWCECKKNLLQKHDKNKTRSWQKYIFKIGVE